MIEEKIPIEKDWKRQKKRGRERDRETERQGEGEGEIRRTALYVR